MDSEFRARVIEAEEHLRQAQMHSDVVVLDELISPELIFTGHVGQLVGKEDDLALHRARVLHLEKSEASDERIQLHDSFAVVSVLMHLVGTYEGTPIDQHMRYTRVWSLSSDGKVQLVAGHMSEVPPV